MSLESPLMVQSSHKTRVQFYALLGVSYVDIVLRSSLLDPLVFSPSHGTAITHGVILRLFLFSGVSCSQLGGLDEDVLQKALDRPLNSETVSGDWC